MNVLRKIYLQAGLPTVVPDLDTKKYLNLMGRDKKVESGNIRFILLKSIGNATVCSNIPINILTETLEECYIDEWLSNLCSII